MRVLERNKNLKEWLAWQEERGGFKGGRERERVCVGSLIGAKGWQKYLSLRISLFLRWMG